MFFDIHKSYHFRYLIKFCILTGIFLSVSGIFSQLFYIGGISISEVIKTIPLNFAIASGWAVLGTPFYFLIVLASRNATKIFMVVFGLILILVEMMLNAYHLVSKVRLGSDFFGYSYEEIVMIVQNSTHLNLMVIVPPFVLIFAYVFSFFVITIKNRTATLALMLLIFSALFSVFNAFYSKTYHTDLTFFIKESIGYFFTGKKADSKKWEVENPYPLYKINKVSDDVLGNNMNLGTQKPNIVLILVEGLGRDFSGPEAEYPGFTPFLDSLSQKSLTWTNFMSNAGRSFGALPSILGSLPFGKMGFLDLETLPDHISLISELKKAGYQTSYFEGGNADFDRKLKYLNHEGMEKITDENNYGPGYSKVAAESGFSWGYPDSEIFRKALTEIKPVSKPRFDMILTISNHEPFVFDNKDVYLRKAEQVLKQGNFSDEKLKEMQNSKDVFAALLYTDNCIRNFINQYKSNPDFQNTIFLITGDHRLIPVKQKNEICRFHVPLIVYSPLISRPQTFKGISSHFDIMPSILAMISKKYDFKMPEKVHWLGNGLSSSITFSNNKDIPFTRFKGTIKDYITGDYFVSENAVYKLGDNLSIEETGETEATRVAISKFSYFQQVNDYVTKNNKIIPPGIVQNKTALTGLSKADLEIVKKYLVGSKAADPYLVARDLAFKKQYNEAIAICDYVIKDSPNNFDCHTLRGRVLGWMGKYDKAEEELKTIIERSPGYTDSYRALMDVYWWSSQPAKARALFQKAQNGKVGDAQFLEELRIALNRFNS
ncbi:MAG: sulfatase-like hydrolase/transferase [Bacteroidetes bacterium]|nr:sulfatase-like hydrolase/transferase [Bacteroidota bacterium]